MTLIEEDDNTARCQFIGGPLNGRTLFVKGPDNFYVSVPDKPENPSMEKGPLPVPDKQGARTGWYRLDSGKPGHLSIYRYQGLLDE